MSLWGEQTHLIFISLKRLKQKIKGFDKMKNKCLPLKDKAPPTEQTHVLLSVIAVLLLYPLMFEPKQ